jgi:hypothetical protein
MTRQILNRYGKVLWSGAAETVRDAIHAAIAARADLTGAVLTGADLTGAVLKDADLTRAVLKDADLTGADLTGAVLKDADLTGAVLTRAVLTPVRDDLWAVLSSAPVEVPALLAALREGRVDGSTYFGECACLVGTLANARGCDYASIAGLRPNSSRPAEMFFLLIRPGQTPENHEPSRIAAGWVEEWLASVRALLATEVTRCDAN